VRFLFLQPQAKGVDHTFNCGLGFSVVTVARRTHTSKHASHCAHTQANTRADANTPAHMHTRNQAQTQTQKQKITHTHTNTHKHAHQHTHTHTLPQCAVLRDSSILRLQDHCPFTRTDSQIRLLVNPKALLCKAKESTSRPIQRS
jgi:hypothetical protein